MHSSDADSWWTSSRQSAERLAAMLWVSGKTLLCRDAEPAHPGEIRLMLQMAVLIKSYT